MWSQGGSTIGPRPWDDEVDIPAFGVHILQTAASVIFRNAGGEGLSRDHLRASRQKASIAALFLGWSEFFASHPLQAERFDRKYRVSVQILGVTLSRTRLDRPYVWLKIVHTVPQVFVSIAQQHV
jgi:hypothetical protein